MRVLLLALVLAGSALAAVPAAEAAACWTYLDFSRIGLQVGWEHTIVGAGLTVECVYGDVRDTVDRVLP